jgi:hypothetical protein
MYEEEEERKKVKLGDVRKTDMKRRARTKDRGTM